MVGPQTFHALQLSSAPVQVIVVRVRVDWNETVLTRKGESANWFLVWSFFVTKGETVFFLTRYCDMK
jgi:hypothetical protein